MNQRQPVWFGADKHFPMQRGAGQSWSFPLLRGWVGRGLRGQQREEQLRLKVKIKALQAEKKRCVTFPPTLLYPIVCLLSTRCILVTELYWQWPIGELSPQSYSWLFKKPTFSSSLCLGKHEGILRLHIYVKSSYLYTVQLVNMFSHIPISPWFCNPQAPKRPLVRFKFLNAFWS